MPTDRTDRCPVCATTGQPARHALLPSLIGDCLRRAEAADPAWTAVREAYERGSAEFPQPFEYRPPRPS